MFTESECVLFIPAGPYESGPRLLYRFHSLFLARGAGRPLGLLLQKQQQQVLADTKSIISNI